MSRNRYDKPQIVEPIFHVKVLVTCVYHALYGDRGVLSLDRFAYMLSERHLRLVG